MDIHVLKSYIDDYFRNGLDLGKALAEEDAEELSNSLVRRLGATKTDLNQSVQSLATLEMLLTAYLANRKYADSALDKEEAVSFVRELAAYIGKVFIRNSHAVWSAGNSFYATDVVYHFSTSGKELESYRWLHYPLWNMALYCIQCATEKRRAYLDTKLRRAQRRKPKHVIRS
jgi:hypothetical protein